MKEMNEKYHVTDEIKQSVEKGKQNVTEFFNGDVKEKVKEGYHNVSEWMKEHHVVEKAAYVGVMREVYVQGMKCVLCIVIKGVVVSTQFIAKSVKEIIAKNKENANPNGNTTGGVIIPPPTSNQAVFPQPVAPAPSAVPSAGPVSDADSLPMATPVPAEVVAQLSSSPRN